MNFKKYNKTRKVLLAILPGIIVAGLIFGANIYYDLDLGKVIVNEITRIIGMFETTATTTLATVSGYVGIKTATPTEALTVAGNILSTGNLTISGGQITGANAEQLLLGVTNDIVNVVRGGSTYIVCDSSGNCQSSTGGYIGGSGTSGYIPKFTGTYTIGNSIIYDTGTNVGIGTTTPAYKLDVSGDLRVTGQTIFGGVAYTWPSSAGSSGQVLTTDGTGNLSWTSAAGGVSGSGTQNYLAKWTATTTLGNSIITDNGTLVTISGQLQTTGTTTLATSSGNVGIGTTEPAYKLTVNGDLYVSATSTLGSATSTPVIFGGYVQSNIIPFFDNQYTLGLSNYRWANIFAATGTFGGTITIGTNTIQGSATTTLFTTGNANQLVLGANGNVGIGTTTPAYKLDVSGDLRVTGQTVFGGVAYTWPSSAGSSGQVLTTDGTGNLSWTSAAGGVSGSGTQNYLAKWTATTTLGNSIITDNGTLVTISGQLQTTGTTTLATSGGNVGIGTTTPAYKLDVSGDLRVTGQTIFGGVAYTWPSSAGSSGQVLTTDGTGNLSWTTILGGGGETYWKLSNNYLYASSTEWNVAIGTTTAPTKLTVSATTTQLRLSYSDSLYADFLVDSSGNLTISPTSGKLRVSYSGQYIELAHTGTKGTLMTSAGDIEIGVSGSPIYLDEITYISATSSNPALTVTQSGTGYAATFMGGNVGIGTTDITAKLTVQNLDTNQASLLIKQSGSLFQKTIGGTTEDYGESIQQTSDGGYVITGETNSFGAGGYDVFVIKLDSSGNLSWAKTIGGTSDDYGYFIQQTSDGGYVITGRTNSFGAGGYDVFVIKLDSSGNLSWAKTIGGTSDDYGYFIQQTSDGGYVITGRTNSFGAGGYDVFVIKLDSSGNLSWAKTIGGTSDDYGYFIQQTSDGGYVITGRTNSFGAGGYDVFVIKLDSSGNLSWAKTIGGTSDDYGYSNQQTSDGGYVITAATNSFGAGGYDVFVIKLDSSGNLSWAKTIGGTEWDFGYSIQQTSDGGYVITGAAGSFGAGIYDVFVIKLDSSGNLSWAKTIGGTQWDVGYSIQQTSDGGYVITGETYSFGAGEYDVFVIKLDSSGNIPDCSSVTSVTPTVSSTTPTVGSPSPTVSSITPTVGSPSPIVSSPNPSTASQCSANFNFTPLVLAPQGNLAIGVTSTQYQLEVAGKIKATQICLGPQCYSSIPEVLWQKSGNNIVYNAGNVGIGTTAPDVKLHVYESALNKSGVLINIATTSASYYSLNVQSAGTSRLYVRADGNVGIGTTTPAYKLDVNGTLGATLTQSATAGTAVHINLTTREIYAYTSSLRFKHDITDLEIDSSKIFNLRPVSFTPNDSDRRDFGLIAEEVEPILPELVLYDAEGRPTAVRYEQLSVLLLNEMKKQKKEIEELKLALNEYGILATSNGATSSEQQTSNLEHPTILDQFTLAIKKSLEKLGLILENGIAKAKEIITEKLTANITITNQLCVGKVCVDEAKFKELLEKNGIEPIILGEQITNNVAASNGTTSSEQSLTNSSSTSTATSTEETNQEISTSTSEQLNSEQQTANNQTTNSEQLSGEQSSTIASSTESSQ